jgi:hypothetical protein
MTKFGRFSHEAENDHRSSRPRHGRVEGAILPSIIGPTGAFESKIYKNVCHIFAISACGEKNKKIFQISDFYSALQSLLVENP